MDSRFQKEERPTRPVAPNPKKRNPWLICLLLFIGILLFAFLLLLILGLTVFKAKDPTITVDSVSVKNLHYNIEPLPSRKASLNATLKLDMSVHNPNKASFKYSDSSANINYNGGVVGEAMIPADNIPSDSITGINTTVTLMADRLLSDANFYGDMIYGSLPFSVSTTIAGKVEVIIIKKHVVTYTSCNITLNVRNKNVTDTQCRSKISL